jgi:hypothetical protein
MTLNDVQFIFNRAIAHTFARKKLLLAFFVLILCGVLVIFFRSLAFHAGQWVVMSLLFLPVFLCAGVLLSTGIILIRIYHDEIKKKPVSYSHVLGKSWEIIIGSTYFSVPIILCYLLLWMFLGIFVLLKEIPVVGEFFGVILAFGPFLLNLGTLLLCILNISMLFFLTPIIALKGINRIQVAQSLVNRFHFDIFSNIFLAVLGVLPLLFSIGLLSFAAFLTGSVCYQCNEPMHNVIQWFFIMIPFTAFLAPWVIFFFNFAAEAHVLLQKNGQG